MNISDYNISETDWEATPASVKQAFISLEQRNNALEEKLALILNKDSTNSSKPPSSDNPYKSRGKTETDKPKRRAGGKVGHKGNRQEFLNPSETIPVFPEACPCGNTGFSDIKAFYTHQHIELPEIPLEVTHFVLYQGECSDCGQTVKASIPKAHKTGFGARLSAFIADNSGIQGNSRRMVKEFCASILKFDISIGAIQKIIDRASESIKPHYERIGEVARESEVNGIDETPWKQNGILHYLWAMVNKQVAFFKIHKNRSKEAFLALVEDWSGILISDGYNVYQTWVNLRQTCLAHLIRHARGLSEHPNKEIKQFGEAILLKLQQLCHMAKEIPTEKQWNEFYTGFIDLLFDNCNHYHCKNDSGKFARRLLREIDSLWVFLELAGVEPTNNATERSLRWGVMWRKRSQGTRSDKGNQWVERILTLRQTARLRHLSSFDILVDAFNSYFNEQEPELNWISNDALYTL